MRAAVPPHTNPAPGRLPRPPLPLLLLLLLLAGWPAAASAEPVETVVNNGPAENRVDIAVMGDGYTAAQMEKYRADVQKFVQAVFAEEPYAEYRRFFNVHRIDVTSAQTGADHPERGHFVDTALDATYNCAGTQRLICINHGKVLNVLQSSLAPAQYDIMLVLVNDEEYGGSGGSIATASTHALAVEIVLHELGHSFGLLADEYGGATCGGGGPDPWPNITRATARAAIKWNYWIDPATPVPTFSMAPGVPGLYEGALYCENGYYRPTFDSKMRTLTRPFEQINTEQLVRRVYHVVSPLDSASPSAASLELPRGRTQAFSVTAPAPQTHALEVSWFVDGQPQAGGAAYTLDTASLAVGDHFVEALVRDTTAFVRSDPEQLLSETRRWDVTVTATPTPTPTPSPTPSFGFALVTEEGTERAAALDSVTFARDPLRPSNPHNFSADGRTRVMLFATGVHLQPGEGSSVVTVQAEDAQQRAFQLVVEHVGPVPGHEWLTQINVRLPDGLAGPLDVWVTVRLRGAAVSNRALLSIAPT